VAAVVRAESPATALQPFLGGVSQQPSVDDGGVHWEVAGADFAARTVLAWAELGTRLRPCENPECRLFLIDRSRANSRRWCSMAACGNRLKARRHQQRQAGARRPEARPAVVG
jgi:predicted RNA-binding Zn ribbon-like protein